MQKRTKVILAITGIVLALFAVSFVAVLLVFLDITEDVTEHVVKSILNGTASEIVESASSMTGSSEITTTGQEPKGVVFVERHNKLVAEYQKIRGQCIAGDITHDSYKEQLNILKEREENLFWEVKHYSFMKEEVDQQHYFYRNLMKFPTQIGMGTTDVHFDKPC